MDPVVGSIIVAIVGGVVGLAIAHLNARKEREAAAAQAAEQTARRVETEMERVLRERLAFYAEQLEQCRDQLREVGAGD